MPPVFKWIQEGYENLMQESGLSEVGVLGGTMLAQSSSNGGELPDFSIVEGRAAIIAAGRR